MHKPFLQHVETVILNSRPFYFIIEPVTIGAITRAVCKIRAVLFWILEAATATPYNLLSTLQSI